MDHFHRFCQNLHGPQVRTCIGKLCAFTCSSNVPKLPGSNASATASLDDGSSASSLDDEALEVEDPSRGGAGGGDPSRGGAAGGYPSRGGGAAGGDSSRGGVPDATDEGVGDLGVGEDATAEAADSATEDNVAASVEGDEGAADDGVVGCTQEGVEDCADESDIA